MGKNDNSKEIFDKYFTSDRKILKILLKDKTALEGIFVGVLHGEEELGESFVIAWHFVPESEIENYRTEILANEAMQEYGRMIKHENIESVSFK